MEMSIQKEIMRQLGGNKFIVMTGATNFVANSRTLSFKIPHKKINHIKITLNNDDLYDIEFMKAGKGEVKLISKYTDVYYYTLTELFTDETGLYTSL